MCLFKQFQCSWWAQLKINVLFRSLEEVTRVWLHSQTKRFMRLCFSIVCRLLTINVIYWARVKIIHAWLTHKQSVLYLLDAMTYYRSPLSVLDTVYVLSIRILLMGDRWNVECFLLCVKKCLCLLSWIWHLPQLRCLAAGVNKLLLQSAEVNGRVSSATVLWSLLLVVSNIWWEERSWATSVVSCWLVPLRPRYVSPRI